MSKTGSKRAEKSWGAHRVRKSLNDDAVRSFLSSLDTPRSLTVWLLYSSQSPEAHQQLAELECQPSDYLDGDSFRDAYLATEFLSKAKFLSLERDKTAVALDKFRKSEDNCRLTNRRFLNLALDPQFKGPNVWLLNATKRKIAMILDGSKESDFCPEEWIERCHWGPGSTFHLGGIQVHQSKKFQDDSGITQDLFDLLGPIFSRVSPLWEELRRDRWQVTPGDKITTVPKNAKTERTIGIGPGLNVYFQLGIGEMMRVRLLRRAGIDLLCQQRNQLLAYYGSRANHLSTIDFSAASDNIASEVVRELLPVKWHSIMDLCRSKLYQLDGSWKWSQKFSSMGNGFTFPLQSLIFFAAASAVCEFAGVSDEYVGVYGDDVILPSTAHAQYVEFCEFLGFQTNSRKSFADGPFRESCGSHYFNGLDVQPIYLKERMHNVDSVVRFSNSIRRLAHRRNRGFGCDCRFADLWRLLHDTVPKELRYYIPEGYGDVGFIVNFDEARPATKKASQIAPYVEGFFTYAMGRLTVTEETTSVGHLIARLSDTEGSGNEIEGVMHIRTDLMGQLTCVQYSLDARGSFRTLGGKNSCALRGVTRPKRFRLLVHSWTDLGPWI